jgi:hypothetical protein
MYSVVINANQASQLVYVTGNVARPSEYSPDTNNPSETIGQVGLQQRKCRDLVDGEADFCEE